jgi:hypothetical protein
MNKAIKEAIPKNLMFRYRIPCHRVTKGKKKPIELGEEFRVQSFGDFEDQANFADVRIGWADEGVYVSVLVKGKKQALWCRETAILESDGVQLWFDTRDPHNVHRASKFCHWFLLMATGGGPAREMPFINTLKINRSREQSPALNKGKSIVSSKISKTGYEISAFIPAESINGWDPNDHQNIGFNYAVVDRELGWQTLALGPELPISEDPSLWQTLVLVE